MWHATTSGPGGELAADGYRSTSAGKFPEPPIYAEVWPLVAFDNAKDSTGYRSKDPSH